MYRVTQKTKPEPWDNSIPHFCFVESDLGEQCKSDEVCAKDNSLCDPYTHTCVCEDGFFDTNGEQTVGGECKERKYINPTRN